MTFTASSPPAFRSYMGIPSHPADFRLDMCLSASFTSISITSGSSSYMFSLKESVGVWVPSVQFFGALLPYFFRCRCWSVYLQDSHVYWLALQAYCCYSVTYRVESHNTSSYFVCTYESHTIPSQCLLSTIVDLIII